MSNVTTATRTEVVKSAFSNTVMTTEQVEIIKNQLAVGISDQDLMYCLEISKQAGLNPILKDIYFVPRRVNIAGHNEPAQWVSKYEPMIGRKGARAIARRKGMKVPPTTGHMFKNTPKLSIKNGKVEWSEEKDLVGWAELIVEGQTVRKEAAFSIYKQTKKEGEITKFWATMPTVMVEKVAEFQLLDAVYGLDGIMSVDAGIVEDAPDESYAHTEEILFNKEMAKSIKDLGLEYTIENGVATLSGDVFNNAKTLKGLNFTINNGKYTMPIDPEMETKEVKKPKPEIVVIPPQKPSNPAKEMTKILKDSGLQNGEIKDFVENILQASSKDTSKLQSYLDNKENLLKMVEDYCAAKQSGGTQGELDF